jgi:hypothetical protein
MQWNKGFYTLQKSADISLGQSMRVSRPAGHILTSDSIFGDASPRAGYALSFRLEAKTW